jgi:hypothetical protein
MSTRCRISSTGRRGTANRSRSRRHHRYRFAGWSWNAKTPPLKHSDCPEATAQKGTITSSSTSWYEFEFDSGTKSDCRFGEEARSRTTQRKIPSSNNPELDQSIKPDKSTFERKRSLSNLANRFENRTRPRPRARTRFPFPQKQASSLGFMEALIPDPRSLVE